jgi:hypothetical protein
MEKKRMVVYSASTLLVIAVIGLVLFFSKHHGTPDPQLYEARTKNVFDSLIVGDYPKAMRDFDSNYRARMSPQEWGTLLSSKIMANMGRITSYRIRNAGSTSNPNAYKVEVECTFERGKLGRVHANCSSMV